MNAELPDEEWVPIIESDEDLDDVFGESDTPPIEQRSSRRETNVKPALRLASDVEVPDADTMTEEQITGAIYRLHEDSRNFPRFPWADLNTLSGPMCPEDLVMVAARTGGGKSLFLQNLFDALICAGRRGLYVGLEQSPEILRIKWACLRTDVQPKLVLAPGELYKTPTWDAAMDKVQQDINGWQRSDAIRARAHFSATRKINAAGLQMWTDWAVERGCSFVIVDHIDRMEHGPGTNAFHEMSETVRLAKELAVRHKITMIVASQVGRPGDALEQFMPPALHQLRGGGTKEEEADTVLGIYRPLRMNVTEQELKQVRQGVRDRDTVIEPNVMGVMLLKHRLDGPQAGKIAKLGVRHQRVTDLAERDRWTTDGYYPKQIV